MFGKPLWEKLVEEMPLPFRDRVPDWHEVVVRELRRDLPASDLQLVLTLTYGQLIWNYDSRARWLNSDQVVRLDRAVEDAEHRLSARSVGRSRWLTRSLWPEALAVLAWPQGRSGEVTVTNGSSPTTALDFRDADNEIAAAAAACLFWGQDVKVLSSRVSSRKTGDLLIVELEDRHPVSARKAELHIKSNEPVITKMALESYMTFKDAPYRGYVR